MDYISNFESRIKEDHIYEEKVFHFTSQPDSSTQKSERSVANEPTSSKVVKEDLPRSSKVLDEGKDGLDQYFANEISSRGVPTRILDDEPFECTNQSLPLTAFQAFTFQGRAKHFFGPRSTQRKDEMFVKTGEDKIASVNNQGKHSLEAQRKDHLLLFRSELGNNKMELQRNRSKISDLSFFSLPPARNKKNDSGKEKKEKATQQNMEKNNAKFKMIVNNLATAVSYSFQNALALHEQQSQGLDQSILTFFLRREVKKMYLIKELIAELEAITIRFKFHEDFTDISETVESLHSLMRKDVKDFSSKEIPLENRKCYPGFIAVLAIIVRIMGVIGLTVAFLGKWSGLLVFIFLVLALFLVIRHFLE